MKSSKIIWIALPVLALSGLVLADWDKHDSGFFARWMDDFRPGAGVVRNQQYLEECGSCHYAYQPALLPAGAWQQVMNNLDSHYGENAELAEADTVAIRDYLMKTAKGPAKQSADKQARSLPRITATRHFRHEHDELPSSLVQGNREVRSFSQCDACHLGAADGDFDEHRVRIPGFGRWDD